MSMAPLLRCGTERGFMLRPVVQRGRVKVRSRWPDERVNFWIQPNLREHRRVAQRPVKFAMKHWLKVDCAARTVVELDSQHKLSSLLERHDSMNRVTHIAPTFLQL